MTDDTFMRRRAFQRLLDDLDKQAASAAEAGRDELARATRASARRLRELLAEDRRDDDPS